jgi:hypothetical protein
VGAAVLLSAQVTHHRLLWLLALSFVLTWVPAFVSLFAVGTLGAGIVILTAVPAQVIAARWLRTQGFLPPSTGPPLQASLSEVSQSAAG